MFSSIFASVLLSTSLATPSLQPKKAIFDNVAFGCYNYKQNIDYNDLLNDSSFNQDVEYTWVPDTSVSLTKLFIDKQVYNLSSIDFMYNSDGELFVLEFTGSFNGMQPVSFTSYVYNDPTEELPYIVQGYSDVFFYISAELGFTDKTEQALFNTFFTTDVNEYFTTYTGYYSMNNQIANWQDVFAFGNFTFNDSMYFVVSSVFDGGGIPSSTLYGWRYDYAYGYPYLAFDDYALPLRNSVPSNQFYFTGVKMPKYSYNRLTSYGVFAFVRDTSYDDTEFKDVLFAVMDSPIYMLSRLLNFELFGMNLFLALCGLVTIWILLFLFKKLA